MPRWLNITLGAVALVLAAALVAAPIGPLPGFWIGGTDTTPPETWTAADLPETVLLKTTGGAVPRVVTLWIVAHDGDAWLVGDPASGWVQSATANPDVTLRIGSAAYALKARRKDSGAAYAAYLERYRPGFPDLVGSLPAPENAGGVAVFQLTAR